MNYTEKAAFIKGLIEGLKMDENKDEVKVLNAITDLLEEIAQSVTELEDKAIFTEEMLDVLDEDLGSVEEVVYGSYDDDMKYSHHHHHHGRHGCCDDEEERYEVTCPTCGNTISIDEEMLDEGQVYCSNCGEVLEFDFDEVDFDEDALEEVVTE